MNPQATRGVGIVVGVSALIGLITVAVTLAFGHNSVAKPRKATEDYGKRLISQTTEYLSSHMNSRLACASCHIGAGDEPGNLSLAIAITKYPRISPRSGSKETIQDRINGCMMRSMNGRALREDSPEMEAMVAYLSYLDAEDAGTGAVKKKPHEPPAFKTPNRAASLKNGELIFGNRCAACHGKEGEGLPSVFPALWGPYSFNDGAGMHRLLTAAKFVKAKMPLGNADLTDDEAFDVAAYFNAGSRPHMEGLERDYPDRMKKPIDTPYGPYADPFPLDQHTIGPFAPIEAWYKNR